MPRVLFFSVALLLLAGCAATPSYRYYGERSFDQGGDGRHLVQPAPGYSGAAAWNTPVWYDYPAYYSVFWSINRWYVDPFWHPHFYYGVTWFPRDYYSVLYRNWFGPSLQVGWYGRPWHAYLSYSPYRYSWIDHYYDWYPWYASYPYYQRYYAPRYGNPRNEAERLARYSAAFRGEGAPPGRFHGQSAFARAARSQALVDARRQAYRGADYFSDGARGRVDPDIRGFDQGGGARGVPSPRRATGLQRVDSGVVVERRAADYGTRRELTPRRAADTQARRVDSVPYRYRQAEAPSAPARRIVSADEVAPPRSVRAPIPGNGPMPGTRLQPSRVSAAPARAAVERPQPAVAPVRPRSLPSYREPAQVAEPTRPMPRYAAPEPSPRQVAPMRAAPRAVTPRTPAPTSQEPRRFVAPPAARAERIERVERSAPVMRGEARSEPPRREED